MHASGIAWTYSLNVVENAYTLACPLLAGFAPGALAMREFRALVGLIAVRLLHLVVSLIRSASMGASMGASLGVATEIATPSSALSSIATPRAPCRRAFQSIRDIVGRFERWVTTVGDLACFKDVMRRR